MTNKEAANLRARILKLRCVSAIQIGETGPTQHDAVLLADVLALIPRPTPRPRTKKEPGHVYRDRAILGGDPSL